MGSYRKVGDDILKEWLDFREDTISLIILHIGMKSTTEMDL